MTLSEASPYPRSVIRSIAAIACLALSGCVTDVVSRAEHAELLSSVRALRAENARLENRLNKLEQDKVTVRVGEGSDAMALSVTSQGGGRAELAAGSARLTIRRDGDVELITRGDLRLQGANVEIAGSQSVRISGATVELN